MYQSLCERLEAFKRARSLPKAFLNRPRGTRALLPGGSLTEQPLIPCAPPTPYLHKAEVARGLRLVGGGWSLGDPSQRSPSPRPSGPPGAGRCPGSLPAAAAPGRRLERVAGPGGGAEGALETPQREASAGPVCAIELLIHREKGRGDKKNKSHVRVIRIWRSCRKREK